MRPRKSLEERKPSGRLKQKKKEDDRDELFERRVAKLGIRRRESESALGGFLAGVLLLRRRITLMEIGQFFSFTQIVPTSLRAMRYGNKVDVYNGHKTSLSARYIKLIHSLGSDINKLHALADNRLTCSVKELKRILAKVPLTGGAIGFMNFCERHHPELSRGELLKMQKTKRRKR